MATIKDEVLSVKEELKEAKKQVKQNSFAVEMLREEKKRNENLASATKRLFIIWIITFLTFICLLGYTIWLLNDITVVETSEEYNQDVSDIGDMNNSNIVNGGGVYGKD